MIISNNQFPEDNLDLLINIQNDLLEYFSYTFMNILKNNYLNAAKLFNIENEMTKILNTKNFFYDKTFDTLFNIIAAYYRLKQHNKQLDLFTSEFEFENNLYKSWSTYIKDELSELLSDPLILKNIVIAFCFEELNDSIVYELDSKASEALGEVYRSMCMRYKDYPASDNYFSKLVKYHNEHIDLE